MKKKCGSSVHFQCIEQFHQNQQWGKKPRSFCSIYISLTALKPGNGRCDLVAGVAESALEFEAPIPSSPPTEIRNVHSFTNSVSEFPPSFFPEPKTRRLNADNYRLDRPNKSGMKLTRNLKKALTHSSNCSNHAIAEV